MVSLADGVESFEAVGEGDRPGRAFGGVAFPPAEARDGPGRPSEGPGFVKVFLLERLKWSPDIGPVIKV